MKRIRAGVEVMGGGFNVRMRAGLSKWGGTFFLLRTSEGRISYDKPV